MMLKRKTHTSTCKKRASIFDVLAITIILFVFVITAFFSYKIMEAMRATMVTTPAVSSEALAVFDKPYNAFTGVANWGFVLLYVGLTFASMIGAYFVNTHPVFFVFSLMMLLFFFVVVIALNNVWADIANNAEFSGYEAKFPAASFIMNHLLVVMIITSGLILIALYAKPQEAF